MDKNKRNFLLSTLKILGTGIVSSCTPSFLKNKPQIITKPQINYSAKELFNLFEKNGLKPKRVPIISLNLNAKTIILIEDNHIIFENEIENMLKIRDILGYNYILGLEGWCGEEIDKKRGRGSPELIANDSLIRKLLNNYNDKFQLIGIEDEKLQIEFINRDITRLFYRIFISKNIKKKMKKIFYIYIQWRYRIFDEKNAILKGEEIYREYKNKGIFDENNPVQIILGDIAIKRDFFAVNKMLIEMRKRDNNIGVIFYGSYHTDNIIRHLKNKLGNEFNLIII